jgi:hypothetical protein
MENMAKKKSNPRLARAGVSGFNKPKRTPSHPTKSHVVVAKVGEQVKTIRFGQQGVTGDKKPTARQKSFKARHAKNIAKGKMSAAYWSNREKW